MNDKQVFLISCAQAITLTEAEALYNSALQINVLSTDNQTPAVLAGQSAPTHSKTNQFPGDDDPDPGQDRCY